MATDAKWAKGKSEIPVSAATPISPKWSCGKSGCIPVVATAAVGPAGVKTVHGTAIASVKTIHGLATASVKTLQGAA